MAVKGIDLTIESGETVTLFGPNGAGKTTLLRMIAGLTQPTSGEILIDGDPVDTDHDVIRGKIGYISHQSLVYNQLTARENLLFFAKLYGVADADDKTEALLKEVGLATRADDLAQTFSRGMKQRLSIARALVSDPQIALLDEPFTGLDQHAAEMLKGALAKLKEKNRTILMITHNLKVGLDMSTRVAALVSGVILLDRSAKGLDAEEFQETYFKTVGEAHY